MPAIVAPEPPTTHPSRRHPPHGQEDNEYWVTFPEYGNQELVRLGSIMLQAKTDKSPARGSGSGGKGGGESGDGGGRSERKRSR